MTWVLIFFSFITKPKLFVTSHKKNKKRSVYGIYHWNNYETRSILHMTVFDAPVVGKTVLWFSHWRIHCYVAALATPSYFGKFYHSLPIFWFLQDHLLLLDECFHLLHLPGCEVASGDPYPRHSSLQFYWWVLDHMMICCAVVGAWRPACRVPIVGSWLGDDMQYRSVASGNTAFCVLGSVLQQAFVFSGYVMQQAFVCSGYVMQRAFGCSDYLML